MWKQLLGIGFVLCLAPGSARAQGSSVGAASYTNDNGAPSDSGSSKPPPAAPIAGETRAGNTPPCNDLHVDQSELEKGFTYQEAGLDWDNATWACLSGTLQSPINFPSPASLAYGTVTSDRAASFALGQATSAQVRTTASYRVQVEAAWQGTNISIPVCGGNVGCLNNNQSTPVQFYNASIQRISFHIPSDHTVYGVQYPMEAQAMASISADELPNCPSDGCQLGISVLFEYFDAPDAINMFLDSIIPYVPYNGAGCHGFPPNITLDTSDALPSNLSYFTYRGSFTAPPCTEGLTWYVLDNPVQVGVNQVVAFQNAMAQVQRPCGDGRVQPVKHKKPSSSSSSGSSSSSSSNNSGRRRQLLSTVSGASACLVSGTRSNNRPPQPLGTRVINFFTDMSNSSAASV